MSWQDDAMIEQEQADALFNMGEAEWRDIVGSSRQMGKTELVKEKLKYYLEHKKDLDDEIQVKT